MEKYSLFNLSYENLQAILDQDLKIEKKKLNMRTQQIFSAT